MPDNILYLVRVKNDSQIWGIANSIKAARMIIKKVIANVYREMEEDDFTIEEFIEMILTSEIIASILQKKVEESKK